jgi:class 3 adenylate cyclase/tetratricopeptide (TPR) repeat protein
MVNNNANGNGENKTDIEEILLERQRLEQVLKDKYSQEVTILFSDICGYTRFVDERGDISGRTMLIKHNQIVLPIVEAHNGKVVEIIGDAVMSCFDDPLDAVLAAASIQQKLAEHNLNAVDANRIHVRIGINIGDALIDEKAEFQSITGDVAIVASRIQREADKDQVMISKAVYKRVCGSEDILCRYHGTVPLKGKAEPQAIYRLLWRDEEIILEEAPKVRVYHAPERGADKKIPRVLHLEVNREGDALRISAHEGARGEAITIRNYEDINISMDLIDGRCQELVDTLNKFNQRGRITRDAVLKLREIGQVLYDELFSPTIKEKLESTEAEFLCLNLDETLVHIPWELLNDGRSFLCRRFAMGRIVKTRQSLLGNRTRDLARPLKMLVMADPTGDLKGAYTEGTQIRDFLDHYIDEFNVALRSDNIYADSIREKMRNFDIVHFAGHADYKPENSEEGGWRLSDGILKTKDIIKMAGTSAMPALIFSNSCQSAREEEWALAKHFEDEIFGMANAFLLAGVKHYVGTFWEIMDEPGSQFALEFYRHLVAGNTVGEAVCQARKALIRQYAEETIVWASYVLYGDPTYDYMDQIRLKESAAESGAAEMTASAEPVRTREEVIDFSEKEIKKPVRARWTVAAVLAVIIAVLLWGYPGFLRTSPVEKEREALAYFNDGNYAEALKIGQKLVKEYPDRVLSHVILGNIFLTEGNKEKAHQHYQNALAAETGSGSQKAKAMIGLGRIASAGNNPNEAVNKYRQAAALDPENAQAYVSQAVILAGGDNYDDALKLLIRAKTLAPNDPSIDAVIADTRRNTELLANREKQARIDRLVAELLNNLEKSNEPELSDGWTSVPLTVWLMELNTTGYSLYEGENRIVHSGISDALIERSRAQVVERALLDKLMQELKLGTSKLADPQTALSLGKILAAKAIVSGRIIHQGPQTQASLRVIETETGEVRAALNKSFPRPVSSSRLAEDLSDVLIIKFNDLYPLRGKVSQIKGKEVIINIGQRQGVKAAQRFKVVGTDVILEVSSVQANRSIAVIEPEGAVLSAGQRIALF